MAKIVLVADHDPGMRKMLCQLFEREADYDLCEQAKTGREAIELAKTCRPDLVILDFSMPGMSGVEAAMQIKRIQPAVPIILFTIHDGALLGNMPGIHLCVDRIVEKAEMMKLLDHVRELAPV